MGNAILAAGIDLKRAKGNSALIIVSDFADNPGIDDVRPTSRKTLLNGTGFTQSAMTRQTRRCTKPRLKRFTQKQPRQT